MAESGLFKHPLSVTGFAACAEFGSYAFVHPLIRRLPRDHHVTVEKGLLRTARRGNELSGDGWSAVRSFLTVS